MVALIVGILIASMVIGDGDDDNGAGDGGLVDAFPAVRAWMYVSIVAAAYIVGRGLAKAGSRDPYWADRDDRPRADGHDRPRNVKTST